SGGTASRPRLPVADRGLLRLGRRSGHPPGAQPLLRDADRRTTAGGSQLHPVRRGPSGAREGTPNQAAGGGLTAEQAPHRPGIAPAPGLRAGAVPNASYLGPNPAPRLLDTEKGTA